LIKSIIKSIKSNLLCIYNNSKKHVKCIAGMGAVIQIISIFLIHLIAVNWKSCSGLSCSVSTEKMLLVTLLFFFFNWLLSNMI